MSALESLRLRHSDPNIAHRCKISYNPELGVVYFYNLCTCSSFPYPSPV